MTTCTFTSMKPTQSAFPTPEPPSISSSSSSLPQLGGRSGFRRVCTTEEPTACPIPGLAAGVLTMRVKEGSKIRNLLGFVMARMQREGEGVDGSQIETMLRVKEGVRVDGSQIETRLRVKEGVGVDGSQIHTRLRVKEGVRVDGSQIETRLRVKEGVRVDGSQIETRLRVKEGVRVDGSQIETRLRVKEGVGVDGSQMGLRQGEGVMDIGRSQTQTGLRVRQVVFTGSGKGITKTITCVEILKRKLGGLHQLSKLHYKTVSEVWESQETDVTPRSRMTVHKTVPAISILLSTHPLDPREPGFQPPETLHYPSYQPPGHQHPGFQPPETMHDPSYQAPGHQHPGFQPPETLHYPSYQAPGHQHPGFQPPETLHYPSYQPPGHQHPGFQPPETMHDPSYQPPGHQHPGFQPPETMHDPSYQPQGHQHPGYQPPVTPCDSVKILPRPRLELTTLFTETQLLSTPLTQKSQSPFWFQGACTSKSEEGCSHALSCTPHLYAASEKEREKAGGKTLYSSYMLPGSEAKRVCMEDHRFPSTPST
ncbi:uncharacterized protein LOC121568048 [Coregonus clupeaformis]|uniref:uncharacterized protein LOC121568048 n=1 Tax=Coregonus clupeaformis TaxID=59861 RepID=UPI001E1C83F6|nr:uncharacterized protein LOC121568048 [Coregonus clupeaformis]